MSVENTLIIRALRTMQADSTIYAFFIPGEAITRIADISRIHRDQKNQLEGFQRKEIKAHVKNIVEYLNQSKTLFPNAIILALSSEIEFKQARGKEPEGITDVAQIGTLHIPLHEEGRRIAWIVDGQQRSLALAQTENTQLPVPVIGFVAEDLQTQREQFILVNKAKPLPGRLINELLPEVEIRLPRDLAVRKIPSVLCNQLTQDPQSPFYQLIKQISQEDNPKAVIQDNPLITMIKKSISNPLGALSQYKSLGSNPSDVDSMYQTLLLFWQKVKIIFPDAWGLPPTKSRLMHSAGIQAMGFLMDRIMMRAQVQSNTEQVIEQSLRNIAPYCCWTSGIWKDLGMEWNQIESTSKYIKALSEQLIHLDTEFNRKQG
ncbi:DGQHR domain-containing protein DpdB [Candidatus Venteria ishoeyi]|uniref:DGQHR domain protein n=1 Tax=Candidatus Venteria ishoeyi TaxID=1899563 RepID=A0A1H6FAN0_9GAMM|nr:DGQHR domain-containing protein DpdB [Candidatus Venteria ishoeyi]SEH06431.1 Uncharacterised protein [Candidatus Venteria ishoeyi]